MAYPSRNTSTYTAPSKNTSSSTLQNQNIETWAVNLNMWQDELRTWAELSGNIWSYQSKN
jgi:hypothetical protein